MQVSPKLGLNDLIKLLKCEGAVKVYKPCKSYICYFTYFTSPFSCLWNIRLLLCRALQQTFYGMFWVLIISKISVSLNVFEQECPAHKLSSSFHGDQLSGKLSKLSSASPRPTTFQISVSIEHLITVYAKGYLGYFYTKGKHGTYFFLYSLKRKKITLLAWKLILKKSGYFWFPWTQHHPVLKAVVLYTLMPSDIHTEILSPRSHFTPLGCSVLSKGGHARAVSVC